MRHLIERGGRLLTLCFALGSLTLACRENNGGDGGNGGNNNGGNNNGGPDAASFIYIETNDPAGNAILAFERERDGTITPSEDGIFDTGGEGIPEDAQRRLGPLQADQTMILSEDERFLFAVNPGSGTIAVFSISEEDGVLTPVEGSPFPSGGENPVSLGIAGDTLYAVNKEIAGDAPPSYTVHTINEDGSLTLLDDLTVTSVLGGSPSIAYVSPEADFLFGTQFMDSARPELVPRGQIDSFIIGEDGALEPAEGSPFELPPVPDGVTPPADVALNLVAHPTEDVLYVGMPTRNEIGVFTFDERGILTFVDTVSNSGTGIVSLRTNEDGSLLYVINALSASITVFDLERAEAPEELDSIVLREAESGPPFVDEETGETITITSQPSHMAFDPSGEVLYVVSQRVTTNADDPTGNFLHVLEIAEDGTLSERADPVDLSDLLGSALARPQGIVVLESSSL